MLMSWLDTVKECILDVLEPELKILDRYLHQQMNHFYKLIKIKKYGAKELSQKHGSFKRRCK